MNTAASALRIQEHRFTSIPYQSGPYTQSCAAEALQRLIKARTGRVNIQHELGRCLGAARLANHALHWRGGKG